MALQIITKKRFIASMKKTTGYLKTEWNNLVAQEFAELAEKKISLIASQPNIRSDTSIKDTKSTLIGKGYQNRIYYRIENNYLIIINLKDTRKNAKQNRYHH